MSNIPVSIGDWGIKSQDVQQFYAGFSRRALPEGALWRLSLASSCHAPNHPGYKAWITMVSGTDRFAPWLQEWAIGLGAQIAVMKPKLSKRSFTYVSSYRTDWGTQASLDGLTVALFGKGSVIPAKTRSIQFGVHRDSYARIRDFVAGSILLASEQYENSLKWAHKVARDS